jgi:hypothetical protein
MQRVLPKPFCKLLMLLETRVPLGSATAWYQWVRAINSDNTGSFYRQLSSRLDPEFPNHLTADSSITVAIVKKPAHQVGIAVHPHRSGVERFFAAPAC